MVVCITAVWLVTLLTPHTFVLAYGPPKGGNPFGVMSPVDSAIGSGVTSGVTTNAPSAVAEGDLEDFRDEQDSNSANGFPYQSGMCYCCGSVCVCVCVCVCWNAL